jgi:hypothetical protein
VALPAGHHLRFGRRQSERPVPATIVAEKLQPDPGPVSFRPGPPSLGCRNRTGRHGAVNPTARPHGTGLFRCAFLAFTRGLEADLTDTDAPVRRLRHGVARLVAGLDHAGEQPE